MSFFYKGCEFEKENSPLAITNGSFNLKSVNGSVLEIPSVCDGEIVCRVYACSGNCKNGLEYFEPAPEDFAFYSVEEIRIPESIEYIMLNKMIFPNLKRVIVDPKNKHYTVIDDCFIKLSECIDSILVAYYGDAKEFVIPDSIGSLDSYAFSLTNLRSIVFPKNFECDYVEPFLCSKWLENFDGAIELNGKVLAFKKEIDEFVITNPEQLGRTTFHYAIPKKVIFDYEQLDTVSVSYTSRGFHCVELGNPKAMMKGHSAYYIRGSESIVVNPENEHYCAIDGVLFTKDKSKLLIYPQFKKDKEYVVPEGVVEIDAYAFSTNKFCEVIKLPTTLRRLCPYKIMEIDDEIRFDFVKEFILPELDPSFRFYNVRLSSVQHFKLPASIIALPSNSFIAHEAVIDATENQHFMSECLICRELLISKKMKFADRGAFCGIEILHVPEYKVFNFAETLFPTATAKRDYFNSMHYLIITREDGSLLRLALPILAQYEYREAIFNFWSINGISIEKYLDAIMKIRETEIKYSVLCYFMENNEEFSDLLFSCVHRIMKGLVAWLIKSEKFELISKLSKSGRIKPALAKKFLQKNLPNELIPIFMSILQSGKEVSLNL